MAVIKDILSIYSWAAIGMLIVFLWRIAYFYQHTSDQRVGYPFLLIPAILLAAGAIVYLKGGGDFTGEPLADLLLFSGGVLLSLFGSRLQELMTGERR